MAGIKPPQDYWLRKLERQKALTILFSVVFYLFGLTSGVLINVWNTTRWSEEVQRWINHLDQGDLK